MQILQTDLHTIINELVDRIFDKRTKHPLLEFIS